MMQTSAAADRSRPGILACVMFLSLLAAGPACAQVRRVVILYHERLELPGLAVLDSSLTHALVAGSPTPLEIYREQLDLSRFSEPDHLARMRDYLRTKYAAKKIDVVIAALKPSLDFALDNRDVLFPGVPIVFCGLDRRDIAGQTLPPYVTGVLVKREYRPTLELALRLRPTTEHIVVVGGTGEFDVALIAQAKQEFATVETPLTFTYLTGRSLPEVVQRVSHLPPHTAVMYLTMNRDGAGQPVVPAEAVEQIAKAANAPVYAFADVYLGLGIVGGQMYSVREHGDVAGKRALEVLAGRSPATLPQMETQGGGVMFDWRELRRWRIPQPFLPHDARIHFKPLSAWDQYRWPIIGVLVIALLQASVILLLALERARRRQSEQRYHSASHAGGVSVWDWNLATNEFYVGPHLKALLGYSDHHVGKHLDDWVRLIHADDAAVLRTRVKDVLEGKNRSFEAEYRMLHREGALHWFLVRGSSVSKHGRLTRITGTATDITERKQAEQALDDVQAELTRVSRLTALGEFSASIAHELRQPLTVIMINVQTCLRWLRDETPDLTEIRTALRETVQASRRAADLIQRNRDLFKMRTVRKEKLDINSLIRDAAVLARPRLQANRVTLVTSLYPKIAPIRGDRIELQQVLLNLIANAIDATQVDQSGRRRIEIRTMMTLGMNVKVCVIDNGVGLDGVDMKKLFTLSYTTKATGSGIGLSLCRSIVEAHGGRLWAEPNPGPGASFFFTIPALVAADSAPALVHPSSSSPALLRREVPSRSR